MCVNIISWNTCGDGINKFQHSVKYVFDGNLPNLFLVQECGSLSSIPQQVEIGGKLFNTHLYAQNQDGSNRLAIGILVQDGEFSNYGVQVFTGIGKRPVVYFECGQFVVATAHLTAKQSTAIGEFKALAQKMKSEFSSKPWLVMGDFNCDPNSLNETDLGVNILKSGYLTHNGNKALDFLFCSKGLDKKLKLDIVSDQLGNTPNESDHYPIRCTANL